MGDNLDRLNVDSEIKLNILLELFPSGDFDYLLRKSIEFSYNEHAFQAFVDEAMTSKIVPSKPAPVVAAAVSGIPAAFDVEEFLNKWPDPFVYFDQLQRTDAHKKQMLDFLKDRFRHIMEANIITILDQNGYNLIRSAGALSLYPIDIFLRTAVTVPLKFDEKLLAEIQLYDHREEIEVHLKQLQAVKEHAVAEGETFQCECCYTDDVLPSETIMCTEAHIFCNTCVKKYVEVRIGEGLVTFPCLQSCLPSGNIPLKTVKKLVNSKTYEKLTAWIQEREVQEAKITGVVFCQRCEYAAILDDSIVIFKCLKCQFELCRKCNKESHVPRKCGETEQEDQQKQIRKQAEETQTSRVLRHCGNCKKPFVKSSGCNLITCVCGAHSCYNCGATGVGYDHVNRCRAPAYRGEPSY
ncbi:ring finger protein 216 [Nesidiocoris tenuis]|uniref:Ring finger protein 216 n=1 Tax=Nesidiocoris tenuis TaxID=355587 RepID=A0ABN7AE65_9HEMI|nr:ring finger protein 216 [Nesidiocoris tenuis]